MAERIRDYECCALFKPDVEAEALDAAVQAVRDFITSHGGEVQRVDRWNKRLLAYPIKRYTDGFYVVYRFTGQPAMISELDYQLRYNDAVLRYLTLDYTEKERKRRKRLAGRKAGQTAKAGARAKDAAGTQITEEVAANG
ncbi:MAG: 30S ribosomal protein S6 [bacterium]|nr:30S ribosomal protein S6 [bacterium]